MRGTDLSHEQSNTQLLQLDTLRLSLGHLVCDLHEHTLVVAATAECAHMVDEKLNLKGVAVCVSLTFHSARWPPYFS